MLTKDELDQLQKLTLEQLKEDGLHDEVRRGLFEQIWDDDTFKTKITKQITEECERFCDNADLSNNRNHLRNKLTEVFSELRYSRAFFMVKERLDIEMRARNDQIKEEFHKTARKFLFEKFIDRSSDVKDGQSIDMDIESEHDDNHEHTMELVNQREDDIRSRISHKSDQHPDHNDIENHPEDHVENLIDDCEDITPPQYSPIGQVGFDVPSDDITNSQDAMNISPITDFGSPKNPADEALEHLTFSEVSSVGTNDLDDFEDTIKLSDDEADFIGKPKDKHVKISVIQDELQRNFNICTKLNPISTPKNDPIANVSESTISAPCTIKVEQHLDSECDETKLEQPGSSIDSSTVDSSVTMKTRRSLKPNSKYINDTFLTK